MDIELNKNQQNELDSLMDCFMPIEKERKELSNREALKEAHKQIYQLADEDNLAGEWNGILKNIFVDIGARSFDQEEFKEDHVYSEIMQAAVKYFLFTDKNKARELADVFNYMISEGHYEKVNVLPGLIFIAGIKKQMEQYAEDFWLKSYIQELHDPETRKLIKKWQVAHKKGKSAEEDQLKKEIIEAVYNFGIEKLPEMRIEGRTHMNSEMVRIIDELGIDSIFKAINIENEALFPAIRIRENKFVTCRKFLRLYIKLRGEINKVVKAK